MTRAAFAMAIRADKAWISNASRILGVRIPLTEESARLHALVRTLQQEFGFSLEDAAKAARTALKGPIGVIAVRESIDGSATLTLDMTRFHEVFSVALAAAKHYAQPMRRGRPQSRVRDAVEAARAYGEDISLIERNMDLTPAERLAELDENIAFLRAARRVP